MSGTTEGNQGRYEPRSYWEGRLRRSPNLLGTGHRQFSVAYNEVMYKVAAENLATALKKAGVDVTGASIMDVGSGLGYFARRFIQWGASHLTGFDIAETSVASLRQQFPGHRFVLADASEPDFPVPGAFDLVSAISVMFHIVDERRFGQALANLCGGVRPGGHLLISDALRPVSVPAGAHVRLRDLESYRPALERSGFRIVGVYPMYYLLGRTYLPVIGPLVLNRKPVLAWLLRVERRWARQERPGAHQQYLIAQRMA